MRHDHFPHPFWSEVLSQVSSRVFQAWTASSLSAAGLPQPDWSLGGVALPQTDLACLLPPHGWPCGDLCDPFPGAQRRMSSGSRPHIGLPSPEARAQAAEVRGDTCYQGPETEIRFTDGQAQRRGALSVGLPPGHPIYATCLVGWEGRWSAGRQSKHIKCLLTLCSANGVLPSLGSVFLKPPRESMRPGG